MSFLTKPGLKRTEEMLDLTISPSTNEFPTYYISMFMKTSIFLLGKEFQRICRSKESLKKEMLIQINAKIKKRNEIKNEFIVGTLAFHKLIL